MTENKIRRELDEETVRFMIRELYRSSYYNESHLDDVAPGYEYAVQQLLDDLRNRTWAFEKKTELEEMNNAQEIVKNDND